MSTTSTRMTGAQALIKALEMEQVDTIFGLPGGCILPAYDPLLESTIRHVLVRHEQGAGHMAEGYAHVTGRPGVAMVTSGPAATNLVTPLMDAYMDSIPMVGITGQVGTSAIGSDAFQECDTVGITRSCTKHNELVMTADDLPLAVRQAFHLARKRSVEQEESLSEFGDVAIKSSDEGRAVELLLEELEAIRVQFEPRQREIVVMKLEGRSNSEIAAATGRTDRTVRRVIEWGRVQLDERRSLSLGDA